MGTYIAKGRLTAWEINKNTQPQKRKKKKNTTRTAFEISLI